MSYYIQEGEVTKRIITKPIIIGKDEYQLIENVQYDIIEASDKLRELFKPKFERIKQNTKIIQ